MYATEQNKLVADDCEAHYKYICQKGADKATLTSKFTLIRKLFVTLSLINITIINCLDSTVQSRESLALYSFGRVHLKSSRR